MDYERHIVVREIMLLMEKHTLDVIHLDVLVLKGLVQYP